MRTIDRGYERLDRGLAAPSLESAEVELETLLWDLEWRLEDAEEADDSDRESDVDDEPGIEEQFVAIYAAYVDRRNPHYGRQGETLSAALLDVLEASCLPWQVDGFAPSSLAVPPGVDLLELAHALYRDRSEHLHRLRRRGAIETPRNGTRPPFESTLLRATPSDSPLAIYEPERAPEA